MTTSLPDSATRLQQFATRLIRVARSTHKEHRLSSSQYSAMALLDANSGISVVELARREGVSHPTMSRLIAGLIRLQLVSSTNDPKDKRARRLGLTPAGQAVYREIAERRTTLFHLLLAQLKPETIADVLDVIERSALPIEEHFRRS